MIKLCASLHYVPPFLSCILKCVDSNITARTLYHCSFIQTCVKQSFVCPPFACSLWYSVWMIVLLLHITLFVSLSALSPMLSVSRCQAISHLDFCQPIFLFLLCPSSALLSHCALLLSSAPICSSSLVCLWYFQLPAPLSLPSDMLVPDFVVACHSHIIVAFSPHLPQCVCLASSL